MQRGRGNYGNRNSFQGRRSDQPNRSSYNDNAPPETVVLMGSFVHNSEGDMLCKSLNDRIPYFNAPIYLENKTQIGKVDEILGPMNEVYFTIKTSEGIVAKSFKQDDKVFISSEKLLPIERFLPKPKAPKVPRSARKSQSTGRGGFGGRGGGFSARGGRGGGFSTRGGRGGSFRGHSGGISKAPFRDGRSGGGRGRGRM